MCVFGAFVVSYRVHTKFITVMFITRGGNGYLSINNNGLCNASLILLHEIGHNLGLSHSNKIIEYGNITCVMVSEYSVGSFHFLF